MLASESTFWICLGKCAQWLLEIQDSRNRLSEWGDGMITNDKFCLIRPCQVQLRWSRRPYRFRPHTSDYLLDETPHREGSHETPLADPSAISADGGWDTAMGSGVSISPTMDDTERAVCRALTNAQTTDGGHV